MLVIDDLISTGGTLAEQQRPVASTERERVFAFAAHGLFVGDASDVIRQSDLAMTFVTDTVPPFRLAPGYARAGRSRSYRRLHFFAEAIRRCHHGGSITELLEGPA